MSNQREIFAAIQRACPQAFARSVTGGAPFQQVSDSNAVAKISAATCLLFWPLAISCSTR